MQMLDHDVPGGPAFTIRSLRDKVARADIATEFGIVHRVSDQIVRAGLRHVAIGDQVSIRSSRSAAGISAEVIAIEGTTAILSTHRPPVGVSEGARVVPRHGELSIEVGDWLLGRVVDGFGKPLDGQKDGVGDGVTRTVSLRGAPQRPLDRPMISDVMPTGVRVIDGLLTVGEGQRIGIFGSPGTGKTSLIGAIARQSRADVVVLGLVGERGREVRDFIDRVLTKDMRDRIVVVASTSDRPAMERVYAARTATAIAEGFRDDGRRVLLIVDSLTRVARALREIGLAAGEPPTRRGFPASVYPALPALIERAGTSADGTITAIYTLLTENDGEGDPIAEEVRSLTDGHIVLSRKLAEAARYPAIDVLGSLSRVMREIVDEDHLKHSAVVRGHLAKYDEIELLLQVGELKDGQDPDADAARAAFPDIRAFCKQPETEASGFEDTLSWLGRVAR